MTSFSAELLRSNGCTYWVCPLEERHLRSLPWNDEPFDAFIVVLEDRELDPDERSALAQIASSNSDWVESCGHHAEEIHDAIDESSVSAGRQGAVGDGKPMTAWHGDLVSADDITAYLALGGLGSSDFKLVCLVARDDRAGAFVDRLREKLRVDGARRS